MAFLLLQVSNQQYVLRGFRLTGKLQVRRKYTLSVLSGTHVSELPAARAEDDVEGVFSFPQFAECSNPGLGGG